MKAILEFNLPEEKQDFENAQNAFKFKSVLIELDNYLRNIVKHNPEGYYDNQLKLVEKIRTELYTELNAEGINLYE